MFDETEINGHKIQPVSAHFECMNEDCEVSEETMVTISEAAQSAGCPAIVDRSEDDG